MPAMKKLKLSIAAKISRAWPRSYGVIVLNLMAVMIKRGSDRGYLLRVTLGDFWRIFYPLKIGFSQSSKRLDSSNG